MRHQVYDVTIRYAPLMCGLGMLGTSWDTPNVMREKVHTTRALTQGPFARRLGNVPGRTRSSARFPVGIQFRAIGYLRQCRVPRAKSKHSHSRPASLSA